MTIRLGDLTIRNLIISYILLYSIMPIVQRLTSRYLTTYFYMTLILALLALIFFIERPKNLKAFGAFLMPFIIYGLLVFLSANKAPAIRAYQMLLFILPALLGYYFVQDNSRISETYSKVLRFAIIVTMITTTIGCIRNPSAARMLATVDSGDAISQEYDMLNMGGYNFVYIMVLLYPVLILAYKSKKIKQIPTAVITIIIFLTIVYTEYTTALLLFMLSSLLFFTNRNLSAREILIISVFAILFLLVFTDAISSMLRWLADVIGSETMASRLNALAGGSTGLENSEDNRIDLYNASINTFLSKPILGTFFEGRRRDGGHSFILDSLAQYGLLGGTLVYFMYNKIFRIFFKPFKNKPGFGYVVWTFIQAIILSLVNTGMWLDVLCLFCPILFYWIYGIEDIKNEDNVDSQLSAGTAG